MAIASAIDYTLGLPAELRAIHPCEHGLVLLKDFLSQPKSSAMPAQPSRAFQGDPLWRVFTQHWAHCVACQDEDFWPHGEVRTTNSAAADSIYVPRRSELAKRPL